VSYGVSRFDLIPLLTRVGILSHNPCIVPNHLRDLGVDFVFSTLNLTTRSGALVLGLHNYTCAFCPLNILHGFVRHLCLLSIRLTQRFSTRKLPAIIERILRYRSTRSRVMQSLQLKPWGGVVARGGDWTNGG
jgi:hypothetical protein